MLNGSQTSLGTAQTLHPGQNRTITLPAPETKQRSARKKTSSNQRFIEVNLSMQYMSVSLERRCAASLYPEHLMCKVSHHHLGGNMEWIQLNQDKPTTALLSLCTRLVTLRWNIIAWFFIKRLLSHNTHIWKNNQHAKTFLKWRNTEQISSKTAHLRIWMIYRGMEAT